MKRIGLMTWYHYNNLGTVLQVTALTKVISQLGYQVDVIRHIPQSPIPRPLISELSDPKFIIQKAENLINRKKYPLISSDLRKDSEFDQFRINNLSFTESCETSSDLYCLNEKYDAFICGSDQIWSPQLFDSKYFLDFVKDEEKMVAYAPSIGATRIDNPLIRSKIISNISRFHHLSVRERKGYDLIKELCNKEAEILVDPTLLLSAKDWKKYEQVHPLSTKKRYILCYFLGDNRKYWRSVQKFAKNLNLNIVVIPTFFPIGLNNCDKAKGVGPGQFLNLVRNAELICTDSFHGIIFSILNHKAFIAYRRFRDAQVTSQNSRIYNLLGITHLSSRLIENNEIDLMRDPLKCDFSSVNELLDKEKEKSISFLLKALKDATKNREYPNQKSITNTCCGCGVCTQVCPVEAISIIRNDRGFSSIFIDQNTCIDCGSCEQVCPFHGNSAAQIDKQKDNLFMLKSVDDDVLNYSSSGGAGYEISKFLCQNGYDVFGCFYDEESNSAVHKRVPAGNDDKLKIFQGSKYLQSDFSTVLPEILLSRKAVVFGTPCQIAGLDKLLQSNGKRKNYILIDLICHGVPSYHLWEKYLTEGKKQHHFGEHPSVLFRSKALGWRKMFISIFGSDSRYVNDEDHDLFYRFFKRANCYLESCYECNYRTYCASDIRLGDFWGSKFAKDNSGVSMVLAKTKTGVDILENLKKEERVYLEKEDCEDYWSIQFPSNSRFPMEYEEILADFRNEGISLNEMADKYCRPFEISSKLHKIITNFKPK